MRASSDSDPEVIYAYTRAQALEDGILVDATALAKEAGFKWPVAVTTRLWHGYIVPALELASDGQSANGRLWDLLTVLHYTILNSKDDTFLRFSVLFLMSPGSSPIPVELISVAGPGDDGEPVITVMLPDED
jgi:hypothetical protein